MEKIDDLGIMIERLRMDGDEEEAQRKVGARAYLRGFLDARRQPFSAAQTPMMIIEEIMQLSDAEYGAILEPMMATSAAETAASAAETAASAAETAASASSVGEASSMAHADAAPITPPSLWGQHADAAPITPPSPKRQRRD